MTIFRMSEKERLGLSGKYVVQRGDTFSKIAMQQYHNVKVWPVIWAYNPRENPHLLKEGETLTIPDVLHAPGVPWELLFLAERVWNRL